jgi:EAL domain-containing protein (putative c-di-GMP-specific phosphodiesterase class I)/ActR/RegA family two-component response regulator
VVTTDGALSPWRYPTGNDVTIPEITQARIVVVDDHPANVALVRRVLGHAGYTRVRGFADPTAALDACQTWDPDLVLLDLHMPHLSGVEFLQILRSRTPISGFVPVLVLTADATSDALKASLRAGANDFATKPIDIDEVLLRVRNLLTIRLGHVELRQHNVNLAASLESYRSSDLALATARLNKIAVIEGIILCGGPRMVFQPIVELASGSVVGVEALARFDDDPPRSPDVWFGEAATVGVAAELEVAAATVALRGLDALPAEQYLAINVSPATLRSGMLGRALDGRSLGRVVIELTEHHVVDDYRVVDERMSELRGRGARLAVDDTGAGFASLKHILKLAPDIIKLDLQLTRDVDSDPAKRALTAALVRFAADIGALITAEGIETAAELGALRDLGIEYGQGYYLGRPAPLGLTTASHEFRV